MAAIFTTLFWCALQVSLFLLLAAPIYLLVRRRNPAAGTAVAASALAAVVALSALAISPWPRWSLEWPTATSANVERAAAVQGGGEAKVNVAATGDESPTPAVSDAAASGDDSLLAAFWRVAQYNGDAAAPSNTDAAIAGDRVAWPSWIVWAIVAGVALGAVRLLVSLAAVRRLIGRSMPLADPATRQELDDLRRQLDVTRPISLHVSAEISTPATVGMFQPAIILPTNWTAWSAVERRAVLAHELAHIAGRDFAAWLVARGAVVLHFYHPLVRWFVGRLQLDQELAADDTAARLLGDRKAYLQALASLALATPHERLAGSLRTFIPTRSLLVRRVEMLRTNESRLASNRTRSKWRWATLPLVGALALLAAGLRPPATVQAQTAEPGGGIGAAPPAVATSAYDYAYVPHDFAFFIAMRPSEIAASPRLSALAELFDESAGLPLPANVLDQATMALTFGPSQTPGMGAAQQLGEFAVYRVNRPLDFAKQITAGLGSIEQEMVNGRPLMQARNGAEADRDNRIAFYSPDDRTLIAAARGRLGSVTSDSAAAAQPPAEPATWIAEAKGPLFIDVNFPAVKATNAGLMGGTPLQMFQPILDLADDMYVTIEDQDPLIVRIRFACKSPQDAVVVEKTVNAALLLLKNLADSQANLLGQQTAVAGMPQDAQDLLGLVRLAQKILDTAKVNVDDAAVTVVASIDDPQRTINESLIPQLRRARQAARRARTQNNLRQLALAAVMYADTNNGYPPAVVYGKSAFPDLNASGNKEGHVPRSWRVELLPLLGGEELYKQYRLDEPWDSEANLKVLQQMPAIYRSPFDRPQSTNASYFAVTGPGTVFDGEAPTPLTAITDGASNTLLWVEAKQEIPWTKPEDIAYEPGKELSINGWMPGMQFNAALCDGSVRQFKDLDDDELKELVGKEDHEAAK